MHTDSARLIKQPSAALSTLCECASAAEARHCTVSNSLLNSGRPAYEQRKGPGSQRRMSTLCGSGGCIVTCWKTGRGKPAKHCQWKNLSPTLSARLGDQDLLLYRIYAEWRCRLFKKKKELCAAFLGLCIFSHLYFSMVWSRNIFPNYLNKEISITSWVNILQPGTCVSRLMQTLIISLIDVMRYVAKKA